MTATESDTASDNEADDSSVAHTTGYSDAERVDTTAALSVKCIEAVGLSVDHGPAEDGSVVEIHTHDDILRGRFIINPDRAEWLGEQLIEHADAARE
jgi:hypothetical protein